MWEKVADVILRTGATCSALAFRGLGSLGLCSCGCAGSSWVVSGFSGLGVGYVLFRGGGGGGGFAIFQFDLPFFGGG